MNTLNTRRAEEVVDQLLSFRPEDATPTTQFAIDPIYTIIAHVPQEINNRIFTLSQSLQRRWPEHYYYDPSQYHLTIVPVPATLRLEQIIENISPIVEGWRLPIDVRGSGVNRFQASAVLYPEEETLVPKRQELRTALDITTQAYTAHHSIWEELLWINFMRFTAKPAEELLAELRTHARTNFGSFVLNHFELYSVSTKTLDPSSSRLLHTF